MVPRARTLLFLVAGFSLAAVSTALASQHIWGMPPCAWCVFQRLIYLVIAFLALLGALAGGRHAGIRRGLAALSGLTALGGVLAAWYQYSVASNSFSCDLTFADRFMVGSGLDAGVPWLFGIFATCMDARVEVLGIEYAIWSLSLFVALAFLSLLALVRS